MGREVHRLSAKTLEKTMPPGYYCDGGGLYLQVSPTQSQSWIFRYKRHGRSREMGLGSVRDASLAQARAKASEARRQLTEGVDPLAAREGRKNEERLRKAGTITFADPTIGELAVGDVDTALVLRVLEPIWATKPETANRVRGRIEHILDYARVRGYRAGENPARWRGHLDKLLPSALNRKNRKHHAALPYDEIGAFLEQVRAQEGTAARALEFTILTAARTQEVIGVRPEEIDAEKALWTIPAGRMKAGKEHRVPLSPQALRLLKSQASSAFVFCGMKEGA